ncbi:hypothetical protein R1sor_006938 [Riccia sorocarpa]|uniref:C2 domain-containing protein n=1 Tax=Riccia sorocarpa TaxID=122646 RepID=A0ABD3HNY8_9MARC
MADMEHVLATTRPLVERFRTRGTVVGIVELLNANLSVTCLQASDDSSSVVLSSLSSRAGSTLGSPLFLGQSIKRSCVCPSELKQLYESVTRNNILRGLNAVARAFEDRQSSFKQQNKDSSSNSKTSRWETVRTHLYPKGPWRPGQSGPRHVDDSARTAKDSEGYFNDDGKGFPEREISRVPPEVRVRNQGRNERESQRFLDRGEDMIRNVRRQAIYLRDRLRALDLKKLSKVDLKKRLKEVDLRKLKDVDLEKLLTTTIDAARSTPLPPLTGSLVAKFGGFVMLALIVDMLIWRTTKGPGMNNVRTGSLSADAVTGSDEDSVRSRAPSALSMLLGRDLRRKESVEWLNMIIDKLWNLYRRGLEDWLVSVLQPNIDNLEKPDYVSKVQVKQFFLGDEPMSVRTVERRTSRRSDDLQYHVGVRYTGGARLLLLITIKLGIIPLTIPVGVRGLDVDAEIWVKFRMIPTEPWVGQATWAFVTRPKIKLALAPFRLVNLMSIPFLSIFLAKLLTEDLPQQFVRPNKNVVDFLQGRAVGPVTNDFKDSLLSDQSNFFTGELSVTLIESRKLSYIPYLKTDPYVIFVLGTQVIRSKRNSQTSVIGPPGGPVWNQDFKLLVVDQKTQHLSLTVHDTIGFTSYPVGSAEIDLRTLQDTVPVDRKLVLKSGWGPFPKRFAGELLLRLTYKAYIDEDGQEIPLEPVDGAYSNGHHEIVGNAVEQVKEVASILKEEVSKVAEQFQENDLAKEMVSSLSAVIDSGEAEPAVLVLQKKAAGAKPREEAAKVPTVHSPKSTKQGPLLHTTSVVEKKTMKDRGSSSSTGQPRKIEGKQVITQNQDGGRVVTDEINNEETPPVLIWLAALTGLVLLVALDMNLSNVFNP